MGVFLKRWLAFGAVWLLAFRPGWPRSGAGSRRANLRRVEESTPTVGRVTISAWFDQISPGGMTVKSLTPPCCGRHSLVCPSAPSLFTPTSSSGQQKFNQYLRDTSQKTTNILIIQ